MLCEVCAGIFTDLSYSRWPGLSSDEPDKFPELSVYLKHQQKRHELERAVNNGCQLCFWLAKQDGLAAPLEYQLDGYRLVEGSDRFELSFRHRPTKFAKLVDKITSKDLEAKKVSVALAGLDKSSLAFKLSERSTKATYTGSPEVLKLAEHWLSSCRQHHTACMNNDSPVTYPSRLLDVSDSESIRLVITSQWQLAGPYATMSHCWGKETFFNLSSDTMDLLCHGVPQSTFLQSFQDAMVAARRLGIQYLWIDCYCILQAGPRSKEDWDTESALMKHIYSGGILNIAATRAAGPHEGCFVHRTSDYLLQPCTFRWRPTKSHEESLYQIQFEDPMYGAMKGLPNHALLQRGWVMQERLLCQRMLHFGKDRLYWECKGRLLASETWPEGYPSPMHDFSGVRYHNLQYPFSVDADDGPNDTALNHNWNRVLALYAACNLTRPTQDKLVAIGGIAEHVASIFSQEYVAGFFKSTLPSSLCWGALESSSKAVEWRAPSWSWASMDGQFEMDQSYGMQEDLVRVCDLDIQLANAANVYGALTSASISLSGKLFNPSDMLMTLRTPSPPAKPFVFVKKLRLEGFEFHPSFDGVQGVQDAVDHEVLILPMYCLRDHKTNAISHVTGLLLVQVGDHYRRIGQCTADCEAGFQSLLDKAEEKNICIV